jgi:hypothetical protein
MSEIIKRGVQARIYIDGFATEETEPALGGTIMRICHKAEITLTLDIEGYRAWRRTLSYEHSSCSGDPIELIREIVERKRFYPSFDLFDCPYSRDDIAGICVDYNRQNPFIVYLFDLLKGSNIEEFASMTISETV